ncbi:MAG: tryptophan--tRNA ligase [Deltaproteobacteria bacterium]|nr:tryptophan--tRNA ligase [Deltaproteobacteria bacterium]
MERKRVLSGMRPSGRLHLGNLHGALDNWVRFQEEFDCFYFVADWHALTTEYAAPHDIGGDTFEMIVDWLAVGIDPTRSTIFIQSLIPEHAELHLLLSMITPLPWLERNPTYKEQMAEITDKDLTTYGFLGYPVLQAADIVLYKAHYVPVGVDQLPHVELTREIVRRFNHFYGEIFPVPEAKLTEVPKLPGVDGRKMSKSYGNAIYLGDSAETVEEKVLTAKTDPARARRHDPGEPLNCAAIYPLHRLYTPAEELPMIEANCRGAKWGCVECKRHLLGHMQARLEPIREQRGLYRSHPEKVRKVIEDGIERATAVARQSMEEVRDAMGLGALPLGGD